MLRPSASSLKARTRTWCWKSLCGKKIPMESPTKPWHIHLACWKGEGALLAQDGRLPDHRANAQRLGLRELAGDDLDLGDAPGWANPGGKIVTLVEFALAKAAASTTPTCCAPEVPAGAIGCMDKAPPTLGTLLRSFRWGHVRELERVPRELLARARAAGATVVSGASEVRGFCSRRFTALALALL